MPYFCGNKVIVCNLVGPPELSLYKNIMSLLDKVSISELLHNRCKITLYINFSVFFLIDIKVMK